MLRKYNHQLDKIIGRVNHTSLILFWISVICIRNSISFRMITRFPVQSVLHSEISDTDGSSPLTIESFRAPLNEIDRRRNFAIISHPDAGSF